MELMMEIFWCQLKMLNKVVQNYLGNVYEKYY